MHSLLGRVAVPLLFGIGATLSLGACAEEPPPPAIYVSAAPPAERVEYMGPAPSEAHVWAPGHWQWNGADYVWNPGHWIARPYARAAWVSGHWRRVRRGWVWVSGHWA